MMLRKLLWLVGRRRKEAELREELEFHLAADAEERRAEGMKDDQARDVARRTLGNVTLVAEDTRAVWGWPPIEQLAQDLRYACRMVLRAPSLTVVVVLTLALGIGLTTAMFSVVRGVLLRPLPFDEPDRLVVLQTRLANGELEAALSPPNVMSLLEEAPSSFSQLGSVLGVGSRSLALGRLVASPPLESAPSFSG